MTLAECSYRVKSAKRRATGRVRRRTYRPPVSPPPIHDGVRYGGVDDLGRCVLGGSVTVAVGWYRFSSPLSLHCLIVGPIQRLRGTSN